MRGFFVFWLIYLFVVALGQDKEIIKCGFAEQLKTGKFQTSLYKTYTFQKSYVSPSGHFKIYYDTTGGNAIPTDDRNQNGIPDRVEIAGQFGDKIWALLIDTLGFHPPYDYNGNFIQQYEIRFVNFGYALYGQTFFDSDDIPSVPGYNMVSHIELNTDYSFATHLSNDPFKRDSLAIAVTISHEFFHAVQLGYHVRFGTFDINDDLWWIEASATVFEEWNVPDGNDYWNYIPALYRYLGYPVYKNIGQKIYGEVVIPLIMEYYWGRDFMREIWEDIIHQNAVETLQKYFRSHGSSWKDILGELGYWCMKGGLLASGYEYPDMPDWPKLEEVVGLNTVNAKNENQFFAESNGYSIELKKIIKLVHNQYLLQGKGNDTISLILWSPLVEKIVGSGESLIFNTPSDSQIFMIQATGEKFIPDTIQYVLEPYLLNDQTISHFFPNPLNLQSNKFLIIQKAEGLTSIELFSVDGRKILELKPTVTGSYSIFSASYFAGIQTGIYFLKINAKKNIFGKLMIIK
jgi:hypothetical protein